MHGQASCCCWVLSRRKGKPGAAIPSPTSQAAAARQPPADTGHVPTCARRRRCRPATRSQLACSGRSGPPPCMEWNGTSIIINGGMQWSVGERASSGFPGSEVGRGARRSGAGRRASQPAGRRCGPRFRCGRSVVSALLCSCPCSCSSAARHGWIELKRTASDHVCS